jgi:hypothetical protein
MTHIYRGVAYNVEADESKSKKAFVGVYRGHKYTALTVESLGPNRQ